MLERVEIRAEGLAMGDRLTEWNGPFHIGPAEGPGERVTELYRPGYEGSYHTMRGFVEAWTDSAGLAGMPSVTCYPWQTVTVWREVSR
jgi:hypothetical protein